MLLLFFNQFSNSLFRFPLINISFNFARLFLQGIEKFGKGQWKNISTNILPSKSPSQIASHAQKYYLRKSQENERKRASIHDLTLDKNDLAPKQILVPPSYVQVQQLSTNPNLNAEQQLSHHQ